MTARLGTQQLVDYNDSAHESRLARWLNHILTGAAMGAMGLAGLFLLVYLYSAISWQSRPFIGVMFSSPDLTVEDAKPFSSEAWPALKNGVRPGDRLIGINDTLWQTEEPNAEFYDLSQQLKVGETVELIFVPRPLTEAGVRCDQFSFGTAGQTCRVEVKLRRVPLTDFVLYFGLTYVAGVIIWAIGLLVLIRRIDTRFGRLFAISAATLAIFSAGQFDIITTFDLTAFWLISNYMFAAAIASFALTFPFDLDFIRQVPPLRYLPFLGAVFLSGLTLVFYLDSRYPDLFALSSATQIAGVAFLVVVMGWRRQHTQSALTREQVTFIGLGTLIAFAPSAIWVSYFILTGGEGIIHELTPVARLALILYALSFAYATLQYNLLETDKIIPEAIIYGVLTALLLAGYTLFTLGLTLVGLDVIAANSPILVAVTIGLIVLFFNPVRLYLRRAIDRTMFQQRGQYLARSDRFARSLTDAVNIGDVYFRIKKELDDTVAPQHVLMFVYNNKQRIFTALPLPGAIRPATDVTFDENSGLVLYLSSEQSVLYLEAGQPLPVLVASDRTRLGLLGTPLLVSLRGQGRLNGFLAIGARQTNEGYTYEDLRFIANMVDQAGLSVERAKFVDDLEHRVQIQDVMSQVSQSLNFSVDFDTLLELIFAQTNRVIEADHFFVANYDAESNELYHTFYSIGEERAHHLETYRWKAEKGVLAEVIKKQQPLLLTKFSDEQRIRNPRYKQDKVPLQGWMGVPLLSDKGGILGLMGVGSTNPTIIYTDEQLKILRDIANVTASAIDKTRLFQQIEKRAAQLKALTEISSQLSSQLEDVDRLLEMITESAVNILGCEAGSLLLLDENSDELVFRVATGGGGQDLLGKRISRKEPSLVANAVNQVKFIITNDPSADARWRGEMDDPVGQDEASGREGVSRPRFHSRAILTIPLLAQGSAVGALQMINKRDGSFFTEEDANMGTVFAGQAAIAIQNARLFESQDQQLLSRVQELETMSQIDQSLNQTVILDELVKVIMGIAMQQTEATHGALMLIGDDKSFMRLIASLNYPEDSLLSMPAEGMKQVSMDDGLIGQVLHSGRALLINVSDGVPYYLETLPESRAQMAAPIISGADTLGVMFLETTHDKRFSILELDFLTRLVDRASSAISNAILYNKLARQTEARTEFVKTLAHELNKPLTSMKGYTDLLQRGVVGELNPQQKHFLTVVHKNVNFMEHLVADVRDVEMMAALNRVQLTIEVVQFREVLEDVLANVESDFHEKSQILDIQIPDDLPELWADKRRLMQIMTNFMTNANKYTRNGGTIVVKAEASENIWDPKGPRQVVHISVKDNGLGISEEDQKKMFQQYFRSSNDEALNEKGTGLGLTLTRRLILEHQGHVWFESQLGEGTTFHFTIPNAAEMLERAI